MQLDKKTKKDILTSWGSAGVGVIGCSPLEVIKMNAQVTPHNITISTMFKDVYKTHGWKGFYKGLFASVVAQPGYWTVYWPVYNSLKERYSDENGEITLNKKMSFIFASSTLASMTVNPLFVFKTRFQTSVLKKNPDGSLKHPNLKYSGLIKNIWEGEGIRGFYKGNLVAQIKNTQMVIQMPLYDYFNSADWNPLGKHNIPLLDRSFASGVAAKTIASCVVYYPMDVIRTNIRDNVENKSISQTIKDIYARPGGVLNFYRGVGVYWISAVPTFGMIMYVYDKLQKHFV